MFLDFEISCQHSSISRHFLFMCEMLRRRLFVCLFCIHIKDVKTILAFLCLSEKINVFYFINLLATYYDNITVWHLTFYFGWTCCHIIWRVVGLSVNVFANGSTSFIITMTLWEWQKPWHHLTHTHIQGPKSGRQVGRQAACCRSVGRSPQTDPSRDRRASRWASERVSECSGSKGNR